MHPEQPDKLAANGTHVRNQPRQPALGHSTLVATNKKRDLSIIIVARDNIATCLIVHILASPTEDFK